MLAAPYRPLTVSCQELAPNSQEPRWISYNEIHGPSHELAYNDHTERLCDENEQNSTACAMVREPVSRTLRCICIVALSCVMVVVVVVVVSVVMYTTLVLKGVAGIKPCAKNLQLVYNPGCNRDAALCMRRYSDVSYATMHNAFATTQDGIVFAQHRACMRSALVQGIRGFMLDVHLTADRSLKLCHVFCKMGSVSLPRTLLMFAEFLDKNPREVVTIIWEARYDARPDLQEPERLQLQALLGRAMLDAGLMKHLHVQPRGKAWPRLQNMIDSNRRLVSLTDLSSSSNEPWNMKVWEHAFDTPFYNEDVADLERHCSVHRGSAGNKLFILNHFTIMGTLSVDTVGLGSVNNIVPVGAIQTINTAPFIWDRVIACSECLGRFPNFVAVDFWESSDVISVTQKLNAIAVGSIVEQPAQCARANGGA